MFSRYFAIIAFELKTRFGGILVWVALWTMLTGVILIFYDSLADSLEQIKPILESFPPQLLSALGVDVDTLVTIEGFINARIITLSILVGGIWAGSMGAALIGRDEDTGALAWLSTQPVSRLGIILSKLFSASTIMLFVNLVIMSLAMLQVLVLTHSDYVPIRFLLAIAVGLSIYYLVLLALGNLGAVLWDQEKGRNLVIFIVMLNFIFNIVQAFEEAPGFVKYLTSYYYFDPDEILETGTLGAKILVLVALFLITNIAAIIRFNNKDIRS